MQELFEAPRKKGNRFVESKDYLPSAIMTLFAYMTIWPVGLVANVIWLREANDVEKDLGETPPNKGCLVTLLWVNMIAAGVACFGFFAVVYVSSQLVTGY
jgi:hypothetical protein